MLYRNGTVFFEGAFHTGLDVLARNGIIACVGESLSASGEEEYDLNGDLLLPGFVDVHIHAYLGQDTMDGEKAVRAMSRALKQAGVAAFLPTTMSASALDTVSALRGVSRVIKNPEPDGAFVAGVHMESPFLNKEKAGAQMIRHLCDPSGSNWEKYTAFYQDTVKMITVAPELPGAMEMIRYLSSLGITVSIGHTAAEAETVHCAADAGATHVTHTFNAQSPIHHRNPGVPGAALTDDRLYTELICDGIHLHPDIVRLIVRAKPEGKAVAVTDSIEAAGLPDGKYHLGGQEVFVKEGTARLASGTLAGSTLTMVQALRNIRSFGIPAETAVAMTTCNPADSVGLSEFGRIRVGCRAYLNRFTPDYEKMTVLE